MASPAKPTVVLLQGTFQLPEVYHKFANLIESRGFPVVQPSFPTLTGQDEPDFTKKTLADDVQVTEDAIRKLVDDGKTVVLAMHSYGGLVGAEAVPEDLTLANRKERGLPGGVSHLFYFSAFVMPKGQSIGTAVGDSPDHDHWDGRFKMRDPLETMYHDLPADEAAYWSAKVIPQSNAVKETVMTRCAYTYVPSTYVVTLADKAVPPPVQEMFGQMAGATIKKIDSGHSAMLSKPNEVLAFLEEAALKNSGVDANLRAHDECKDSVKPKEHDGDKPGHPTPELEWLQRGRETRAPQPAKARHIGKYAMTTEIAPWVKNALENYQPTTQVQELVKPFTTEFHRLCERERETSFGLHDIDAIELTYQYTLIIGAAILLAADATEDPVSFDSFTLEPNPLREDYVYSALTGVDCAKGQNKFNNRLAAFESLARASVPTLDDSKSGEDRCFWRLALGYLRGMNDCENAQNFKAPRKSAIEHGLDHDLVIVARALDTIGSAYMSRDGASWLDNEGMDSLIGSALPNDVMDLHTDIFTGETRNLLRLLYPSGNGIAQAIQTTSSILSTMLCEIFRGHHRARMHNREDGRISSTSPPYSFSRARHRRIFETLELYINQYPQFWEWTWEIYNRAKSQMTEAALAEPLVCALKRAATDATLPDSVSNRFFNLWYDMVEDGSAQLSKARPLGVSEDLAPVVRDLHNLWHQQLRDDNKQPGWGREFDHKSDMLLGDAGTILSRRDQICDDTYRFTIAYGRLSMSLPYIAYHTVDAIIMAFGAIPAVRDP
ncbi:hypothetical protein N0V90_002085 [Kalmusia sp. IMI 367209]|nr:hypothetical protein N0V90_002085 [Kalmusia sp. IMI 367209]